MARRTLTLLGPDVLLVAMGDARPNNALFVIECEGHLEPGRVDRALATLAGMLPWMGARLERPFPWGRLRWTLAGDADPIVTQRVDGQPEATIEALLNTRIDPYVEPPLRLVVVHGQDVAGRPQSWLVVAWVHALMDPRGVELLATMLDAVDSGGDALTWARARLVTAPPDARPWRARLRMAQRGVRELEGVAALRPRSFGGTVVQPGRTRYRRVPLGNTAARQLPTTLALVAAAVADLWQGRGVALAEPIVVPISVDRRLKGEPGPVFGNHLSFYFARLDPALTTDVPRAAAAIRRDLAEAVRTDAIEVVWIAMNFARYHPPAMLLRPLGGDDMASFNCADTGEVRPLRATFLGCAVATAYHVPCVQPRPGLGVFFSRTARGENLVAVWVEPAVAAEEIDRLIAGIASAVGVG
jgi:hypothetical protein